jgi:octaprenyl-diphosphate synthase
MVTIEDIRRPITADLEAFDLFVAENFTAEGELLQEMLTYTLSSRGKGIRPMLTLLSASLNNSSTCTDEECGK